MTNETYQRVAWVTGASRGLGRALALGLARAGYRVAVTARDTTALAKVADEIRAVGVNALAVPADVADSGQVRAAAEHIQSDWGRLDSCIAAAGVSPALTKSVDVPDEEWRHLLSINLDGAFWTMREAARAMSTTGGGSIIALSSVHARSAGKRLAAYSASKGAIEALVRTLAVEWVPLGIRVNALAPGYFETDLTAGIRGSERLYDELTKRTPMGRFGTPDELVAAALFLASPESAYTTGSVLSIDGGWTAG
ncbi:glucose 1-dehydrogenase [Leifsonia bigeumensis]|uniref:Glucose 1-dehydrogenase n=1 Tax=Leifsonella bigeumensis TaxID=433643 RepID=A0ABP7F9H2_9MICO